MDQRLHALRGAISVPEDQAGEILEATTELMNEIMARNELDPAQVVSCIFTVTDDLTAEFPAVAARALGFERVPLLCAREIPVPGSLQRVIRVLIHYYAADEHEARHVYLREAATLRADLQAAQ
jgi:chorismate mutase